MTTAATAIAPGPDAAALAADPLTLRDYCDVDGPAVAAVVRVTRTALTLTFCKHHYEADAAALAAQGWTVTDDRRPFLA